MAKAKLTEAQRGEKIEQLEKAKLVLESKIAHLQKGLADTKAKIDALREGD